MLYYKYFHINFCAFNRGSTYIFCFFSVDTIRSPITFENLDKHNTLLKWLYACYGYINYEFVIVNCINGKTKKGELFLFQWNWENHYACSHRNTSWDCNVYCNFCNICCFNMETQLCSAAGLWSCSKPAAALLCTSQRWQAVICELCSNTHTEVAASEPIW